MPPLAAPMVPHSAGVVAPRLVEVERFDPGDARALAHLESRGFVVFKDALDGEEVERAVRLLWEYLEGLGTGISRDDPATWSQRAQRLCLIRMMTGFSRAFRGSFSAAQVTSGGLPASGSVQPQYRLRILVGV